jgi:hypothetical protein
MVWDTVKPPSPWPREGERISVEKQKALDHMRNASEALSKFKVGSAWCRTILSLAVSAAVGLLAVLLNYRFLAIGNKRGNDLVLIHSFFLPMFASLVILWLNYHLSKAFASRREVLAKEYEHWAHVFSTTGEITREGILQRNVDE